MSIEVYDPQGQLAQLDVPMVKRSPRSDGTVSLLGKGEDDGSDTPAPVVEGDESPARATFTKDPVTGDLIFSNGTRVRMQGGAEDSATTEAVAEAMDAARAMIDEALAAEVPTEAKFVEHEGVKFWIRQTAANEQLAEAFQVGRDTKGELSLTNKDFISSLMAGAMHLACVRGKTDMTPLFESYDEARRLACKPGWSGLATTIFNAVWGENPDILKNLGAG